MIVTNTGDQVHQMEVMRKIVSLCLGYKTIPVVSIMGGMIENVTTPGIKETRHSFAKIEVTKSQH